MPMQRRERTTPDRVGMYEVAMPLLSAMYQEFSVLSKKKPDGPVSKGKIGVVNRLLDRCRSVLKSELSLQFLDLLDEDEVPQNSDVTLMLSQYVAAMEQFKQAHYGWDGDEHRWFTED